jgi:hypothetical protein
MMETGSTIQYAGLIGPDRNDRYFAKDSEN